MRNCAGLETGEASAGLGVPDFHVTIVGAADELSASGVEVDVRDALCVAGVGSEQLAVAIDVEDLYLGVCRSRQEQMVCRRNKAKSVDRLRAMPPCMYELSISCVSTNGSRVVRGK